ncbi:hypothetical protein FAM09_29630 [Niastella caeni]|uniref:Redoxin domain-containing protein n=1 Tax=Niastella caeni TaxID=2569763 RepID=A0A4S8H7V3_9BACT|nr:hypothetical protein [Niastella caeni]THU30763.1 hypothetical protein FAM09_29630 [Niastella caeni]
MIKKIIFSVLLSMQVMGAFCQDFYSLSFKDSQNNSVSLQSFSGKKIVIAVFDAAHPNEEFLKKLDTLYRNNSSTLQVIAVPLLDFGKAISNDRLTALYNRLQLVFIISQPGNGKKVSGGEQQSILQWVTNKSANKHFDNDVEEPGQLFVIDETGNLFAVMKSKVSPTSAAMTRVISTKFKKP